MKRNYITGAVFLLLLAGLTIANLFYAPPTMSSSERRVLKTMPELTSQTLSSGKFMQEFEDYALDAFLGRDGFRSLKAQALFGIYRQLDNNGYYKIGDHAAKIEELDEASVTLATQKFQTIADLLPASANLYYAYIPEKGYFLAQEYGYPGVDYARLEELLAQGLDGMTAIDLAGALRLEDYYKTDLHWDQSKLKPVVERLGEAMGVPVFWEYTQETYDFRGVYAGQLALPLPSEALTTLYSPAMDSVAVSMLDPQSGNMEPAQLYDEAGVESIDPYNIFLSGAQPLIQIENPNAPAGELVIFRDSFSSSLAPLLAQSYSKIILVDLRYFSARLLEDYVTIGEDADVLFLYGMQLLNSATTLIV